MIYFVNIFIDNFNFSFIIFLLSVIRLENLKKMCYYEILNSLQTKTPKFTTLVLCGFVGLVRWLAQYTMSRYFAWVFSCVVLYNAIMGSKSRPKQCSASIVDASIRDRNSDESDTQKHAATHRVVWL